MGQLLKYKTRFNELGYQIIAVSADKPEKLQPFIEKHKISFLILSDNKLEGARSLGIAYQLNEKRYNRFKANGIDLEDTSGQKHHSLPVPAVFIIGMDGIIKFQYVNPNHRIRVHPDILLAAAKSFAE